MGEIFALQGRGECGKSFTINELFRILDAKYPNCVIKDYFPKEYDIKIEMKINNILIGIESKGDPDSRLEESLNDFEKHKCDIIFCAARTRGMTVDWINSHKKNYHINFIKQTIVANNQQQSQSNKKVAQDMINKAGL